MLRLLKTVFLMLTFVGCFNADAQVVRGRVIFLGIGVESCLDNQGDTVRQPFAIADVQLVLRRTQADATMARSISYSNGGSLVQVKEFVPHLLYGNKATIRNIDSVLRYITQVDKPQPTDLFYICISAPDSGDNFFVPAEPEMKAKKPKVAEKKYACLTLENLRRMCQEVDCANQMIVANNNNWEGNEQNVWNRLFCHSDKDFLTADRYKEKYQVLIYPSLACTDSFIVDGKPAPCFGGSIYECNARSLLEMFVVDDKTSDDVTFELNAAFRTVTRMSGRFFYYKASWETDEWKHAHAAQQAHALEQPITQNAPGPAGGSDHGKDNAAAGDLDRGQKTKEHVDNNIIKAEDLDNYALIIVNEDYKYPCWTDLKTPVNDGDSMKAELEKQNFVVRLVKNVGVDSIHSELDMLAARKTGDKSQVLFYYAGHGGYDTSRHQGYIVPVDAPETTAKSFKSKVIMYAMLIELLDGLEAQHVMVMVDACFSGSINPALSAKKRSGTKGDVAMVANNMLVHNSMISKSRCYLTSGALNKVPDGDRNSPFAKKMIQRMRENREKGAVTFFEDLVSAAKSLRSHPQDGVFGIESDGDMGDFIFCPKKTTTIK